MKNLLLTLIAGLAIADAGAQQTNVTLKGMPKCAFNQIINKTHNNYLQLLDAYRSTAALNTTNTAAKGAGIIYDIPVVVHVVYSAATPTFNIPDSVIKNQITVLTKAYRKQHADTGNARSYFKSLSGDAEIQFHLATTDPAGNATNGITRTLSTRSFFGSSAADLDSLERVKHTATGGIDAWPTTKYLNIWVCNMADGQGQLSVLGYGIPPLNPLPGNWPAGAAQGLTGLVDGVVLQTQSVGDNNPLVSALQGIYTKGRAAVHEVGHYLGLQHVFGSNDGSTIDCGTIADDGIGDTPTQGNPSFDQNSGTSCPPSTKNTCGASTTGDLPDLWEDYMDYAHDACQVLFTHDQITIMRGVLANQRIGLSTPTGVTTISNNEVVAVYPNPAQNTLSVSYDGKIERVSVRNLLGQELVQYAGSTAQRKTYDISGLPSGSYVLVLEAGDKHLVSKFTVIR